VYIGREALIDIARRMSEGSGYSKETGGQNGAWAGELFELCGFQYLSLDLAPMYKTEIFDLNRQTVLKDQQATADIVLNFDTTEHIFNQYNAFKVIHDYCRPGGYMVHQLPCSGYCDHGYYQYTGRFFFELAAANGYKLDYWDYHGPDEDNFFRSAHDYAAMFPAAEKFSTRQLPIPSWCIFVVFKKGKEKQFRISQELSTCVNRAGVLEILYGRQPWLYMAYKGVKFLKRILKSSA